jgi:hypothetical protein
VDAQDRLIAELQGGQPGQPGQARKFSPPPVTAPVLQETDLRTFLSEGIEAMVAPHAWPVASHNKVTYVCEDGAWHRATDAELKAVATSVLAQLAQLFPAYVERKGWLQHDPKGLYPEKALKVYGIQPGAVQKALLKKAQS